MGWAMEWYEAGALIVGLLLVFMALSIPVAFSFFAVSIIGMLVFIGGEAGLAQITANVTSSVTLFVFVPIPLFLLMGELFFHTGFAVRVFDAFDALFGRLPGRLSYLTVAGGTVFATLSGTSMGSTAMLGALMVPEMSRRGYKRYITCRAVAGAPRSRTSPGCWACPTTSRCRSASRPSVRSRRSTVDSPPWARIARA